MHSSEHATEHKSRGQICPLDRKTMFFAVPGPTRLDSAPRRRPCYAVCLCEHFPTDLSSIGWLERRPQPKKGRKVGIFSPPQSLPNRHQSTRLGPLGPVPRVSWLSGAVLLVVRPVEIGEFHFHFIHAGASPWIFFSVGTIRCAVCNCITEPSFNSLFELCEVQQRKEKSWIARTNLSSGPRSTGENV